MAGRAGAAGRGRGRLVRGNCGGVGSFGAQQPGMAGRGPWGGDQPARGPGAAGTMRFPPPPAEWLAGPGPLAADEVVSYVVTAAVWAPSVHNSQPWRFGACGQEISLHADAGRQLMVADPHGREMMISCGAALFNARLALRSLGYVPET